MKLKELRKQNGKTQIEMAKFLNIAQTTYAGYETLTSEPTIETLKKLADYYGVSLDYLCDHKTNNLADFGELTREQILAIKILLSLPQASFYEYLGRLKTTAELLKIEY